MKTLSRWILLAAAVSTLVLRASVRADDAWDQQEKKAQETRAAFRTVFYAVLEGCFADGLTDADVDQILQRDAPDGRLVHFIYSCPICMATEEALETYRARAKAQDKTGNKVTFGQGLSPAMHDRLYSADHQERLAAIHDLEESWVSRHVESLRLTPEELARTQSELKTARERGMEALQSFLEQGTTRWYAPGYHAGDECALCNAAAGMKLKLAAQPPNP